MNSSQTNAHRFRIDERLGGGGMGDVFRAFDTERGQTVALKMLRHVHPRAILQFKAEFRTLANFAHRNLVALYDLVNERDEWFFTMELVNGTDFLSYVRGVGGRRELGSRTQLRCHEDEDDTSMGGKTSTELDGGGGDSGGLMLARPQLLASPPRLDLLRRALRQLAQGLHYLHGTGHLHRDVKPSNVLVAQDGRVVLVDFGIIAELGRRARGAANVEIAGTPAFMAPEQADPFAVPAPASDWYSLGVLLFAALAGYVPFGGTFTAIMAAKVGGAVPDLSTVFDVVREQSPDLVALCRDLLDPDPARRPSGEEVIARLGGAAKREIHESEERIATAPAVALVGRREETATLERALDDARRGRGGAALVRGVSGMGKSALVDHFLSRVEARGDVEILVGRCYESESVPFKTLDSLVDSLCRSLQAGRLSLSSEAMPADAGAVGLVFPVLQQLPMFADAARVARASLHADEHQRRAFEALIDLLTRLSKQRALLLYIDDLQWGDVDSLPVVSDLLRASDRRILFLGAYRSEEADKSPVLRALAERLQAGAGEATQIDVGPLSEEAVRSLVEETLGDASAPELVRSIAHESGGHPYLAHELARYAGAEGGRVLSSMTLDAVIRARAAHLSPDAKALLRVIAVAGRPISNVLAQSAAQLDTQQRRAFVELRAGRFIRTSGSRASDAVEAYHDRIRETVTGDLEAADRRDVHFRIAKSMDTPDPKNEQAIYALAHHYFFAEAPAEARRAFEVNAEAAKLAESHHAHAQAYTYLTQAQSLAQGAKIELSGPFLQLFGDVASLTGRAEQAVDAYGKGLAASTVGHERAALRMGLARLAMAQLDMKQCHTHATDALRELDEASPRPGLLGVVGSLVELGAGLRALENPAKLGSATGEALAGIRQLVHIHDLIGYVEYFQMDNVAMLQCLARNTKYVAALGSSFELTNWYALAGITCAVLGRREWAARSIRRALEVAQAIQDPAAEAYARTYGAHAFNMMGEPVEAERALLECLQAPAFLLPSMNFLTAVADYGWTTLMRGYADRGLDYVHLALKRVRSASRRAALTEGHTYRCYAGPMLALLGREREGAAALADFESFLATSPHEPWRHASFQSHRMLYAALAEDDEMLERAIEAHRKMNLSPGKVRLQLRQGYVGVAMARVRQLERADASTRAAATERCNAALAELEKTVGGHPTLRAHLRVLEARASRLREGRRGTSFSKALDEAASLAEAYDNPWVCFEVMIERALAHKARGKVSEAIRELDAAAAVADKRGWGRKAADTARLRATV